MKQTIRIIVEVPDRLNPSNFKRVFNHALSLDDSLKFDYTHVVMGLNCLFPDGIITFKVM